MVELAKSTGDLPLDPLTPILSPSIREATVEGASFTVVSLGFEIPPTFGKIVNKIVPSTKQETWFFFGVN